MMLGLVILLMIAGTVAILLWPLMRRQPEKSGQRLIMISIISVVILVPAGAITLYMSLGAPGLAGMTQPAPAPESKAALAAEAAEATRAVQQNPGVETYNHLGNILFRMGNYEAAEKAYEDGAKMMPTSLPQMRSKSGDNAK